MTWLILYILGATDAAMTGYRAAAGRSALIRKRAYYRRAVLKGLLYGHAVLVPAGLLMAVAVRFTLRSGAPLEAVEEAGRRMLLVYLPYAALILTALLARAVPQVDVRSLTSVLIFGPLTFVRPAVAVAGVFAAWSALPDPILLAAALIGIAGLLALETHLRSLPAR